MTGEEIMNFYPLVSIIIPLYNGSNYVEQAILSAIQQTYNNIEIIVVNDGSIDEGAGRAICEKFAGKIIYMEKENGGCSSALNYGIRLAHGEYISWLSHDDLYDNQKIEKQIMQYEKHNLDMENTIIGNSARLITATGEKLYHPRTRLKGVLSYKKAYKHLLHKWCFNGCGLLIPKAIFEKAGYFNENLRFVLDWNMWLKCTIAGVNFYYDNEILVSNRCHGAQVTTTQKYLHLEETAQTLEELFIILTEQEDFYLIRELYYFCYATNIPLQAKIREYCKKKIYLNRCRAWYLRGKRCIINVLKKIYHNFRK